MDAKSVFETCVITIIYPIIILETRKFEWLLGTNLKMEAKPLFETFAITILYSIIILETINVNLSDILGTKLKMDSKSLFETYVIAYHSIPHHNSSNT
jgi:hypothetical protein